ncbi:hypothetical protein GPECTOR_382g184 [Gonium pectorale]|uniref:Uncharacterized protein n=1 Tax=Gonium pectorale TaxID=33097 RepID=A0A150FVE9_GONPE|nr:hypothetical protein GPECTOR_382g184 [Gonium pectorale]|eukprot:KXZ41579.1 hypothetical protein GPECTOR_382g184 [Gonium pectorale]
MKNRIYQHTGKLAVVPFLTAVWASTSPEQMCKNHDAASMLLHVGAVKLLIRRRQGEEVAMMMDAALAPKTLVVLPRGWKWAKLRIPPLMIDWATWKHLKPLVQKQLMP